MQLGGGWRWRTNQPNPFTPGNLKHAPVCRQGTCLFDSSSIFSTHSLKIRWCWIWYFYLMCLCEALDRLVYDYFLLQDLIFKKNSYGHNNVLHQSGLAFNVFKSIKWNKLRVNFGKEMGIFKTSWFLPILLECWEIKLDLMSKCTYILTNYIVHLWLYNNSTEVGIKLIKPVRLVHRHQVFLHGGKLIFKRDNLGMDWCIFK